MMGPVELTARAICKAYYQQIAETGGVPTSTVYDADTNWQDWITEARAALNVAVEIRKSEIRAALQFQHHDMGPGFTHIDSPNCGCQVEDEDTRQFLAEIEAFGCEGGDQREEK